jgi:hypothetical protein
MTNLKRAIPDGSSFGHGNNEREYTIGEKQTIYTRYGTYDVGGTGSVIQTEEGYFLEKRDGKLLFSNNLQDVNIFLPENESVLLYADTVGIKKGKVLQATVEPIVSNTLPHYHAGEVIKELFVMGGEGHE